MDARIELKLQQAFRVLAEGSSGGMEATKFFAGLVEGLFLGAAITEAEYVHWRDALYDKCQGGV